MSEYGVEPKQESRPTAGPAERWRLGNWRLRSKLVAVLAVPLLLACALGAFRIAGSAQEAASLDAQVDRFTAGQQVALLIDALQRERAISATFVAAGRPADRAALDAATRAVDSASPAVTSGPVERLGSGLTDVTSAARVRIGDLAALRRAVIRTAFPPERVEATYTAVIDSVRALERGVLSPVQPSLVRPATDALLLADAKEEVQRQHAVLNAVLVGGPAPALADAARQVDAQLSGTLAELSTSALASTRERFAGTVAGTAVDGRERIAQQALVALALGRPVPPAAADWDAVSGQTADLIGRVATTAREDLVAAASALAGDARAAAVRDGLLVVALLALTMVLLVLVARSLLRPLRALRVSALEIAEHGLPERTERMVVVDGVAPSMDVEPIGVHTRDEIGEVARAFDAVHAAAVRLAAQQALLRHHVNDIFVNLSQRSQSLVSRQLQLIDWLERSEQDPVQLGELYRLDHLAARMRRNNENLLVLAGESPQRSGRVGPASLQDVAQAAVSEIEQYRRVNVGRAPDIAVVGPVAADLVHLLAELLDNATTYGPPGSLVALDVRLEPDGGIGIDVIDGGAGIEAAELATLNARLADPPPVDATVSRRMGLFVVGRLAQNHGIAVTLHPVPGGPGTRATVTLPSLLLSIDQVAAVPGVTRRIPAAVPEPRSPWPALVGGEGNHPAPGVPERAGT